VPEWIRNDPLRVVTLTILLLLLIVRAIFPDQVYLDAISITLILVAAVLALSPLLKFAKLPGGTEFRFRNKIGAGEKLGVEVEARMYEEGILQHSDPLWPLLIDITSDMRAAVADNPADALAQLRRAFVKGLRRAAQGLRLKKMPPDEPEQLIEYLAKRGGLWGEQSALMRVIWDLTTGMPLQGQVSAADAERVLALADVLNDSFNLGYSLNFEPNEHWQENGLICQFEHCIENMQLPKTTLSEHLEWREHIKASLDSGLYDEHPKRKAWFEAMLAEPVDESEFVEVEDLTGACPIFGHYCPGGEQVIRSCEPARAWVAELPTVQAIEGSGSE
jgi:hypothetical protein